MATYYRNLSGSKQFLSLIAAIALCLVTGCSRQTPESYWRDAESCLDDLQKVDDQIEAGHSHAETAPDVVAAKIAIDKFERHYDGTGIVLLNRELQTALDACLDAFVIDDTINRSRPILLGSIVEQRLTQRYPELAGTKVPGSSELDGQAALVIVRKYATQHAKAAREIMASTKYMLDKNRSNESPRT